MAAVAPHDTEDLCAPSFGKIDGLDDIGANVPLSVATTDREHKNRVLLVESAGVEPCGEHRVPALVVGACGEFGDIVGRTIGLDAAELTEVVDRVTAVAGAAPYSDQKQPSTPFPQAVELAPERLDRGK